MFRSIMVGGVRALAVAGFAALVLAALIAWPVRQAPELTSISDARKSVDFRALPAVERFQARDGTALGFRHYPVSGAAAGRVAIVIHGSSGSSGTTIHALSGALARRAVAVFPSNIPGQ